MAFWPMPIATTSVAYCGSSSSFVITKWAAQERFDLASPNLPRISAQAWYADTKSGTSLATYSRKLMQKEAVKMPIWRLLVEFLQNGSYVCVLVFYGNNS